MKVAHQIHPWTPNPIDFESEETEVKKDKKWLKDSVTKEIQDLFSITNLTYFDFESTNQKLRGLVDQLDEPETNSQIDKLANFIMSEVEGEPSQSEGAVDTAIRIIKSYQNQETLSSDWIEEHSNGMSRSQYIWVDDLKELLVPKQEEVDRAYKDGYEKGREFGFYKGYREGLADKGGEPETVADVVITFWKSYERLKEVMSMEVEELEE